jgi:hypothetical protein
MLTVCPFFTHTCIGCCTRVHYTEVFFAEGTRKSVQCSELGGVHLVEVHLQLKLIGGTHTSVQIGGVHLAEVFIKGGFTVLINSIKKKRHIMKN